jgi:predicted ABC-type ATPase
MPSYSTETQIKVDRQFKLRLEKEFLVRWNRFEQKQTTIIVRGVARNGRIPNLNAMSPELERMLNDHFLTVGKIFTRLTINRVEDAINDLGETKSVLEIKAATTQGVPLVVARNFRLRAADQARRITNTSKKQAALALRLAKESADVTSLVQVEELNIAEATGTIFRIKVNGRAKGIARLNTNATAETAKLTQIQIMRGEEPSITGGKTSKTFKEWHNISDSDVRTPLDKRSKFNHLLAEQRVFSHEPFIVSGEKLMFPADTSLGASIGNVAECRCSATYDIKEAAQDIRSVRERDIFDTGREGLTRNLIDDAHPQTFIQERLVKPQDVGRDGTMEMFRHKVGVDERGETIWGEWTAKRQALHKEIIDEVMRGARTVAEGVTPELQLIGGGSASGKSSLGLQRLHRSVKINIDEIKGFLPEFRNGAVKGKKTGVFNNRNAAGMAHEESSFIGKEIIARTTKLRANATLDQTGGYSVSKFRNKLKSFMDEGYVINANYVTVETETALVRAKIRGAKIGRQIDESVIKIIHANVSRTTEQILKDGDVFDSFRLVFGKGQPPITIAETVKGKLVIKNQQLWDDFIAKGRGIEIKAIVRAVPSAETINIYLEVVLDVRGPKDESDARKNLRASITEEVNQMARDGKVIEIPWD